MCASWLQRHRCARGARDGGDTMESGIAVHPLASTEPHGALECAGVALETHDGGVVENNGPTDSAAAKGGENHARHIPESDSPEKPDTPPSRLSLDQLRAEIDAAVGTLPEILRVCTVDALSERVAPVFQDADHARCVKRRAGRRLPNARAERVPDASPTRLEPSPSPPRALTRNAPHRPHVLVARHARRARLTAAGCLPSRESSTARRLRRRARRTHRTPSRRRARRSRENKNAGRLFVRRSRRARRRAARRTSRRSTEPHLS